MSCVLDKTLWKKIQLKQAFDLEEAFLFLETILTDAVECSKKTPNCICSTFVKEHKSEFLKYAECLFKKRQSSISSQSNNTAQDKKELDQALIEINILIRNLSQ